MARFEEDDDFEPFDLEERYPEFFDAELDGIPFDELEFAEWADLWDELDIGDYEIEIGVEYEEGKTS